MTFSVPGYRVDQLLGRGCSAEVWSGRKISSDEAVALKRIVTTDGDVTASARAEAALLASLDHPSLLRLLDFVVTEGAVVLVMELADGGSLAQLLDRRDRLTPGEVASTLSPVAAALAAAHHEGLLHGDVSAANVLFASSGHAKLADFGIARMIGGSADVLGTPAYVDSVIAAGGVPGPASDVFSLGALALHCLTGSGPWHVGGADSVETVLAAAATGSIPDLPGRLAHCPPELAAVVMRALDPEPYRRGTAAEFALDLRASTRPVPVMLTGGRVAPKVGRHSLESRRRPGVPRPTASGQDGTDPAAARPAFSRPARIAAGPPPAELTHVSRPQVRPAVPVADPGPRLLTAALRARGGWLGFGAVLVGSLAALGIIAALVLLPRRAASLPRRAATVSAARTPPASGAPLAPTPSSQPTHGSPDAGGATAREVLEPATSGPSQSSSSASASVPVPGAGGVKTQVAAVLAKLDTSRARAFELRRPDLLTQVYGAPGLVAQDADQLAEVVPPTCGATGLHTRYQVLSALQAPNSTPTPVLQAIVTANLAAGDVVCHGAIRGRTRAVGPVTLRLTLRSEGGGYRIVSERTVS